jgi:hypothetical protein
MAQQNSSLAHTHHVITTNRKEAFHPNPFFSKYFDPGLMGFLVPLVTPTGTNGPAGTKG